MKIGHIELFVIDPLASKHFYQHVLGFEVVSVQDEQFVWMNCGEMELLLRPGNPPSSASDYDSTSIGFVLYTDDLDRDSHDLRRKGIIFNMISPESLTFKDPDGNWFQLVQVSRNLLSES